MQEPQIGNENLHEDQRASKIIWKKVAHDKIH